MEVANNWMSGLLLPGRPRVQGGEGHPNRGKACRGMSGVNNFCCCCLNIIFVGKLMHNVFQLEPRRVCKKVTRLVPYLEPEEECMLVPREVRGRQFY